MKTETAMLMEIESWENRSGSDNPHWAFGYVYFADGSRVGYAMIPGEYQVFEPRTNGNGKYMPVTLDHLRAAARFLTDELGIEVSAP